ncbi:hypothetical protein Hanom_Chr13g01222431 [Helianthus anomalus]
MNVKPGTWILLDALPVILAELILFRLLWIHEPQRLLWMMGLFRQLLWMTEELLQQVTWMTMVLQRTTWMIMESILGKHMQ